MNAMVHDMTWDVIQEVEGDEIVNLSESDQEKVGGGWLPVAIAAIRVATHPVRL